MTQRNLIVLRTSVPVRDVPVDQPVVDFELIRQMTDATYASSNTLDLAWAKRLAGKNHATAAAFAAWSLRKETDNMFTTGEEIAFRLLPLLSASGWKGRVFSLVHAIYNPKWIAATRLLGTVNVGAYIAVSRLQRDILVNKAGLAPDKVHFLHYGIDSAFFDPAQAESTPGDGYVFACGLENRDYATLSAATAKTDLPVRVQASGNFPQENVMDRGLPANFEINRTRIAYSELRNRYAGARFVVVPLHEVPYAAGVTGLLEGMAMGKAVIVTGSPGIADYTGLDSVLTVPAADPVRLAAAMDRLWQDPAACAQMGRVNREWVLRHAEVRQHAAAIADCMRAS